MHSCCQALLGTDGTRLSQEAMGVVVGPNGQTLRARCGPYCDRLRLFGVRPIRLPTCPAPAPRALPVPERPIRVSDCRPLHSDHRGNGPESPPAGVTGLVRPPRWAHSTGWCFGVTATRRFSRASHQPRIFRHCRFSALFWGVPALRVVAVRRTDSAPKRLIRPFPAGPRPRPVGWGRALTSRSFVRSPWPRRDGAGGERAETGEAGCGTGRGAGARRRYKSWRARSGAGCPNGREGREVACGRKSGTTDS